MSPSELDRFLGRVVEAYGGADRWRAAVAARGTVRLGGQLFRLKRIAPPPVTQITTQLGEPYAHLDPIDADGNVGVFTGSQVRIESRDGEVLQHREDGRGGLPGAGPTGRSWDVLDLTYFLGHAFWGYNALIRWLLRDDVGKRLVAPAVLEVTLPPGTPAHSLTQQFWFDADTALLRRNDYHPDVVTPSPRLWVANFVRRHRRWEGIPYPSRRRVTRRPGHRVTATLQGRLLPPTFVAIDVTGWHLTE